MKASDLRVGNLVNNRDGKAESIDMEYLSIFHRWCITKYTDDPPFTPIPLTEEWLERFGFEVYGFNDKPDSAIHKRIDGDQVRNFELKCSAGNWWFRPIYGHCSDYTDIKHVHQLQNLYHALTGEELKIN